MSNKGYTALIIFVFGLLFFAQDWWFISDWDDYFYKFVVTDDSLTYYDQLDDGKHQFVDSFIDIIESQCNHYLGSNGRFIVHCIVQFFTSLVPLWIFPIFNSLIFVLLLYVLIKLTDEHQRTLNSLFTVFSLVIGCPVIMSVFLANISVSVNYLWSCALVYWWYFLYEKKINAETDLSSTELFMMFFTGLIVGSLQESFSIGMCAGLLFYHLLNLKRLTWTKAVIVGSFGLGACFCIFAPSNFQRVDGRIGVQMDAIWYLIESYSFVICCMILFFCLIFSYKRFINFLKNNAVLVMALVTTFLFTFFVAFNSAQQLTNINILLLILALRLVYSFTNDILNVLKCLAVIVGVFVCIVAYPQMYKYRNKLGETYYDMVNYVMTEKPRFIVDKVHGDLVYEIKHSNLAKYFNITPINGAGSLSIYMTKGKSRDYIEGVVPLPMDDIESKCHNLIANSNVAHVHNDTYAFAMNDSVMPDKVHWIFSTYFRNPNKPHDMSSSANYRIKYDNKFYYIFNVSLPIVEPKRILVLENN